MELCGLDPCSKMIQQEVVSWSCLAVGTPVHQGWASQTALHLMAGAQIGKTHLWCPVLTSVQLHSSLFILLREWPFVAGEETLSCPAPGQEVTFRGTRGGGRGYLTVGDAELLCLWGLKGCQRAVGITQVLQACRKKSCFEEKGLRGSRGVPGGFEQPGWGLSLSSPSLGSLPSSPSSPCVHFPVQASRALLCLW